MLATMTHARLRLAQGDLRAAREILRAILRLKPEHREASDLLRQIAGQAGRHAVVEPETSDAEPVPARAADLSERFREFLGGNPAQANVQARIARLEGWLSTIRRNAGLS